MDTRSAGGFAPPCRGGYNIGMNINIKATNMELTPAIASYVEERVEALEKFIPEKQKEAAHADVEVGVLSHHHRSGDIFRAEINLKLGGDVLRAVAETDDLYAAIDEMKSEISREINSEKGKRRTMIRKGKTMVKNIIKGFKK